jgi:DNA polymerase IV
MKKASVILHGLDRSGEASADLFDHEDSCSERDGCAERAP